MVGGVPGRHRGIPGVLNRGRWRCAWRGSAHSVGEFGGTAGGGRALDLDCGGLGRRWRRCVGYGTGWCGRMRISMEKTDWACPRRRNSYRLRMLESGGGMSGMAERLQSRGNRRGRPMTGTLRMMSVPSMVEAFQA
eukprot:scaffold1836_cov216-Amphora_coffeaeformis.AAC.3